jgi:hypothetical protein
MYLASSAFSKTPFLTPQRNAIKATIPIVAPAMSKDQTLLIIFAASYPKALSLASLYNYREEIVKKNTNHCENNRNHPPGIGLCRSREIAGQSVITRNGGNFFRVAAGRWHMILSAMAEAVYLPLQDVSGHCSIRKAALSKAKKPFVRLTSVRIEHFQ